MAFIGYIVATITAMILGVRSDKTVNKAMVLVLWGAVTAYLWGLMLL